MQIILLKDVKKLGKKNDIKKVADGFALNYLIPQNLAVAASDDKIKQLEKDKQKTEEQKNKGTEELNVIINKLKDKVIEIKKEASDKGKLFAAVNADEIIDEVKKRFKTELDKSKLKIKEHIKEIGEHSLELKIGDRKINIKINITKK